MMKNSFLIILLLLVVACEKQSAITEEGPMQIYATTKASADEMSGTPVFIFWFGSDFDAIADDVYTQPYFYASPSEEIDAYKYVPYDTGKPYPSNDQEVCCTGYSPASLVCDYGNLPRSWTTLTLLPETVGLTDVMVAPSPITGRSSLHFGTDPSNASLEFIHAQSKITFKVRMGTDMARSRDLRNIKITIPGTELLSGLKWNKGRYVAEIACDQESSVVLKDPSQNQLDPSQKIRTIGDVYIFPGKSSLRLKVEVEMSDSPLFTHYEVVSVDTEVPFNLTDGVSEVLRENDAYEIILVVNYDSIVLKGNKSPWTDGGNVIIPIYPDKAIR